MGGTFLDAQVSASAVTRGFRFKFATGNAFDVDYKDYH
jgi:hypothetical protein